MEDQNKSQEIQEITPQKKIEILRSFFAQGLTGNLDLGNSLDIKKIKNKNGITIYKVGNREDSYNTIPKIKNKTLENAFILNPKDNTDNMVNSAIFILNNFPNSKLIVILGDIINNKNNIQFSSNFQKIKYLLKKLIKDFGKMLHFTSFENFRGFNINKDGDINNIYNENFHESYKFIKRRGNKDDLLFQLFFTKKLKNKINTSLYSDLSDKILSLGFFDPSVKYSKSELYILFDSLTGEQRAKLDPILRQAEIAFQRPINNKSTLNFLIRHRKDLPEIAKGKYFTGVYCDFDGTLFEDTVPGSTDSLNPKVKSGILNYLLRKQKEGVKITIMTGGDLEQRKNILKQNGINFPIVHKSQLAGGILENAIDDTPNSKVFHSITKILAVNYIQVDQIG